MNPIKVGIIGIGHLGSKHLKVYDQLQPEVKIVGICDIKEERTQRLASHYHVPCLTDYRRLADQVDAVNICVPTEFHFEIARFFLENGIHTFIEKPITLNLEQADTLIHLAEKHNLKLQVGHVERFNSAFQAIKHLTPQPLFIECHRLSPFPNRSLDIGVIMDLMIHDIDIVLGLNHCAVKSFHAVGASVLTAMEDIASVRVIFENGCVCNMTASRVSDEVMRKIRIFLKDAYISLDYVKQEAFIYKKDQQRILKHALPIEREEPLKKELESFIHCIRHDQRPVVSGIEARNALELALGISQDIQEQYLSQLKAGVLPVANTH
jgi:predicted dehydrogenase